MAQRGWDATGLLRPIWHQYGGRDKLAAAVGTQGTVLSEVNSGGRRLGLDLAGRLASAAGVRLVDLGAPEGTDADDLPIHVRLAKLGAAIDEILANQEKGLPAQARILADLQEIREALGLARSGKRAAPKRSPGRTS